MGPRVHGILEGMAENSLTDEVVPQERPQGAKGENSAGVWDMSIPSRRKSKCQGPVARQS